MAITLDTFKTFLQGAGNNIQAPEGGGVSQRLVLQTVNGELRLQSAQEQSAQEQSAQKARADENITIRNALLKALTGDYATVFDNATDYKGDLLLTLLTTKDDLTTQDVQELLNQHTELIERKRAEQSPLAESLLDNIAASDTRIISAEDLAGLLPETPQENIDSAVKALKAAYDLKPGSDGTFSTEDERTVKTAITKLLNLRSDLNAAYRERKLEANCAKAEELIHYCDARVCELIKTLCLSKDKKLLASRTIRLHVAEEAKRMHGADDFAQTFKRKVALILDQINGLSTSIAEGKLNLDNAETKAKISQLRKDVQDLRGKLPKDSHHCSKTLVKTATDELDAIEKRLDYLTERDAFYSGLTEQLKRETIDLICTDLLGFDCHRLPKGSPKLLRLKQEVSGLMTDWESCIERNDPLNTDDSDRLWNIVAQRAEDVLVSTRISYNTVRSSKEKLFGTLNNYLTFLNDLKRNKTNHVPVTGEQLKDILVGKISAKTLFTAKAYGFSDPKIDARLGSERKQEGCRLGNGQNNTVYEAHYNVRNEQGELKDEVRVFKSEVTAMLGIRNTRMGRRGYADKNRSAIISMACHGAAKLLKADSVVDDVTVGEHDGKLGFFMKKAKGLKPVENWRQIADTVEDENNPKAPLLKKKLLIELNRMAWVDWLTGQSDRHAGNYLVWVDNETGSVEVKAIDNDASFPDYRIGLRKFKLDKVAVKTLLEKDKKKTIGEFNAAHPNNRIVKPAGQTEPEIDLDPDDAIDNNNLGLVIKGAFNIKSACRPGMIPRDMYEALHELSGKDDEELLEEIGGFMEEKYFTQAQRTATLSRLKEMIAHAEKLKEGDMVIDIENMDNVDAEKIFEADKGFTLSNPTDFTGKDPSHGTTTPTMPQYHRQGFYYRDFVYDPSAQNPVQPPPKK